MVKSSYPYNGQPTTDLEYSRLFRELQDDGVIGSFGDASLKAFGDNTGMVSKVPAGDAILRGFFFRSTAVETVTHAASNTSARIDRVVLRLSLSAAIINRITIEVLTGVPGSNPSPPTLTKTDSVYEIPLARVIIGASATSIAPSDVVDERDHIGHRVRVWNTSTRPVSPRKRQLGFNETTQKWESWNGTAWVDLTQTVTWASLSGVPATFPPAAHSHAATDITSGKLAIERLPVGTTGTTVAQGDHTHAWSAITAKPAEFPPSAHSHTWASITGKPTGFTPIAHGHDVTQVSWARIPLHTYIQQNYATIGAVNARATVAYVDQQIGGRAVAWEGDGNSVRYAHGPHSSAYNRQAGNNRFATWMDDSLIFGRATSSLRYKDNVSPWELDQEAFLSIEPKTFHRKVDAEGEMDYGGIAEELEAAGLQEFLYYDEEGRPDAIKEHHLPWALLAVVRSQRAQIEDILRRLEERGL